MICIFLERETPIVLPRKARFSNGTYQEVWTTGGSLLYPSKCDEIGPKVEPRTRKREPGNESWLNTGCKTVSRNG